MGAESSPLVVKRSAVRSSIEQVHLLGCDQHRHLDGLLRLVEVGGLAGASAGFPGVAIFFNESHFAELGLAEPESVPLVGTLPERLLSRRPLQRFSSAPASSCAALRLRRRPSASRIPSSPWRRSSPRTPSAPAAARPGSWSSPRAARGSSRPGP